MSNEISMANNLISKFLLESSSTLELGTFFEIPQYLPFLIGFPFLLSSHPVMEDGQMNPQGSQEMIHKINSESNKHRTTE
jgi:hypothetical protein